MAQLGWWLQRAVLVYGLENSALIKKLFMNNLPWISELCNHEMLYKITFQYKGYDLNVKNSFFLYSIRRY